MSEADEMALDAIAFVRAVRREDSLALGNLLVNADPAEMLLALAALINHCTEDPDEALDAWHTYAMSALAERGL